MNKTIILFVAAAISLVSMLGVITVNAVPVAPDAVVLNTSEKNITAFKVNSSVNNQRPGGYIFTAFVNGTQQNHRWKGYVGNVTGTFVLEDASANIFFEWELVSINGEVFATRTGGSVNWSGLNCSWVADGSVNAVSSNRTLEITENTILGHVLAEDSINSTFAKTNHSALTIADRVIGKNECFSLQTNQNDQEQVFADSDDANFTEVILYDGAPSTTNGSIVYATILEQDTTGYNNQHTYDFQMIVPESNNASATQASYFFFVELS